MALVRTEGDLDRGILTGTRPMPGPTFLVEQAQTRAELDAYRALRRQVFVAEQGIFAGDDADRVDDDPRTIVLLARTTEGALLGGVRIAPAVEGRDIGWWSGSRLAVSAAARTHAENSQRQGQLIDITLPPDPRIQRGDAIALVRPEATYLGWVQKSTLPLTVDGAPMKLTVGVPG